MRYAAGGFERAANPCYFATAHLHRGNTKKGFRWKLDHGRMSFRLTPMAYFCLFFIAAGLTTLLFAIPSDGDLFFGIALVTYGIVQTLLFRISGRAAFKWGKKGILLPGSGFWSGLGVEGSQKLYLGIGIVSATMGFLFLLKSAVR